MLLMLLTALYVIFFESLLFHLLALQFSLEEIFARPFLSFLEALANRSFQPLSDEVHSGHISKFTDLSKICGWNKQQKMLLMLTGC